MCQVGVLLEEALKANIQVSSDSHLLCGYPTLPCHVTSVLMPSLDAARGTSSLMDRMLMHFRMVCLSSGQAIFRSVSPNARMLWHMCTPDCGYEADQAEAAAIDC